MGELCPNLKLCILGKQSRLEATAAKGTPRQGKKLGKAKAATEVSPAQAKWADLKEELLSCSMEAYRIWSSALSKVRVRHIDIYLCFICCLLCNVTLCCDRCY